MPGSYGRERAASPISHLRVGKQVCYPLRSDVQDPIAEPGVFIRLAGVHFVGRYHEDTARRGDMLDPAAVKDRCPLRTTATQSASCQCGAYLYRT
jgi:hypothetical protein